MILLVLVEALDNLKTNTLHIVTVPIQDWKPTRSLARASPDFRASCIDAHNVPQQTLLVEPPTIVSQEGSSRVLYARVMVRKALALRARFGAGDQVRKPGCDL